MTREEALNILHNSSVYHPMYLDALNMAIKALEQEPCEDCHFLATLPSVQPKTNVLDKLRAEIEEERKGYPPSAGYYKAIVKVLQILDKYKAESEDKE